jgi:hypothetical protein
MRKEARLSNCGTLGIEEKNSRLAADLTNPARDGSKMHH